MRILAALGLPVGLLPRRRAFARLFAARGLSSLSGNIYRLALAWLILVRTGSPLLLGGMAVAMAVASLLAPWLGAIADRLPKRRVLVATDLGCCAACGGLAALGLGLGPGAGVAPVYVLIFAVASLGMLDWTALHATIPLAVAPEELTMANGLWSAGMNAVALGAPALAGVAVAAAGPVATLAVAALGYGAAGAVVAGTRLPAAAGAGAAGARDAGAAAKAEATGARAEAAAAADAAGAGTVAAAQDAGAGAEAAGPGAQTLAEVQHAAADVAAGTEAAAGPDAEAAARHAAAAMAAGAEAATMPAEAAVLETGALAEAQRAAAPMAVGAGTKAAATAAEAHRAAQEPARRPAPGIWADVREGIRYVLADPVLTRLTLLSAGLNLAYSATAPMVIYLLQRRLGLSPAAIGLVFAAEGVGTLAASAAFARFGRRIDRGLGIMAGGMVLGLGLEAWALAGSAGLALLAAALVGFAVATGNLHMLTLRQEIVPPALLGRTLGTTAMLGRLVMTVAPALGAALVAGPGLLAVFAGAGGVAMATAFGLGPGLQRAARARGALQGQTAASPG